jgi:ATP-binding cassette, subfamily B, multidrug efflux pump
VSEGEHFEGDEVFKSYDSGIMRRLLGYLGSHKVAVGFAVLALFAATAAELALPAIVRRATDSYILPYHSALVVDKLSALEKKRLEPLDQRRIADDLYFAPAGRLAALSAREREEMRGRGALLEQRYVVVDIGGDDRAAAAVVAANPELFRRGAAFAAIAEPDLKALPRDTVRDLRAGHVRGLAAAGGLFFAALLAVYACTFAQINLQAWLGQSVMRRIRTGLYEHILRLSLRFLDRNPVGRLVNRVTNDVETINELFTEVMPRLVGDVCMMVGVMIALFLMNTRLGLVAVATLPPVFLLSALFRTRARDAFRAVRTSLSRLNAFVSEHISGMRVVQIFVRERRTLREFQDRNEELLAANLGEMHVFAVFRPLVDLLATSSLAVVLYFGGRFLLADIVSLGVLIAFLNLIRMFYQPVMDLSEQYNVLQSAMAGAERVFGLLDADDIIPEPDRPAPLERARGAIEFDRVSFAYNPDEPVLRDLSFAVRPGETVAIVGYTGAGKTTIASLLTRMWDVGTGRIRLDGVDVRDLPTAVLRKRVQAVLQDVFLFSGTILENIRLGEDIPLAAVEQAVRLVRADTFIDRLPRGLDTPLHERASNLSMGQRQLLSFARVLAHNPDVLVLDEATGNIDTETERLIQAALGELLRGRTSLVIAHRLSTIRRADRIMVLHRGHLAEEGTHDSLMATRGLYHNLYRMQYLDTAATSGGDAG